jgi:putative FmdB family regulatory protein
MPTYEYACNTCGEHLDVVQSFSDDPLTTCPNCGGELRKVFGAIGIVLKGSGFYKNDSRSSGKASRSSSSGGESGNGKSVDSTSTDSGAAQSTDAKGADKGDKGKKEKAAPSKAASAS